MSKFVILIGTISFLDILFIFLLSLFFLRLFSASSPWVNERVPETRPNIQAEKKLQNESSSQKEKKNRGD